MAKALGASPKQLDQVTLDMSGLVGVRKVSGFHIVLSVKGSRGRLNGVGLRPLHPRSVTLKTIFVGGGGVEETFENNYFRQEFER